MPRAAQHTLLDRPFAKRTALMRALVIEGGVLTLVMSHANRRVRASDRLDAALGKFAVLQHLLPHAAGLAGGG